MIIKNIHLSGFERIHEGLNYCRKESRQGFTTGLFSFLEHSLISFELEDVTSIELFYLKKFSSVVKIIDKTYSNFCNEEVYKTTYDTIDQLLKVHNMMLNDEDINKEISNINKILPIGCEKYHVFIFFKGSGIVSITGTFMNELFTINGEFQEQYPGDYHIENKVAELFYKNFYSYISDKMTELDIVTEYMTNKKFYQYGDDRCTLAHLNTPFGMIEFFGVNQDRMNHQLKVIKDAQLQTPYYLKDHIYLTFVFKTSFSFFFNLYLNTNYVIDHEHLKIVYTKNELFLETEIVDNYYVRLSHSIDYLNDFKKELLEETSINLSKFNYIFNGNNIVYSVQIPLSEINTLKNICTSEEEQQLIADEIEQTSKIIESLLG